MSFLEEVLEMERDRNSPERRKRIERQLYLREEREREKESEIFNLEKIKKLVYERCRKYQEYQEYQEYSDSPVEKTCANVRYSLDPSSDFDIDIEELTETITIRRTKETFKTLLIQYMDRRGVSSSDVYQSAQILKQTFSKIMTGEDYKISKDTAIQICFALHLTIGEAEKMLGSAGFSLAKSDTRDVLFRILLEKGYYNITDINIALSDMNLKTFGRP